ncbi:MAG: caspase [Okeania sp. SIO2F4]|uniref:caspase family protein n=1 Tax=Okeania sp. SIO2F4 TaxID=2607790 RepID=UPI001429CDF0|nr:caspase family protein [Okeania sp. SIO2F4]NES05216.1 caspase [Okeania sp. SIO2F4]
MSSRKGRPNPVNTKEAGRKRGTDEAKTIYALLVGIDEYTYPVSPLKGCVNDITAVKEYLEGSIPAENLHIRTLLNQEATRENVINGFREHLCQAGSEDVALFYFAGHGAQEDAPKEFWHIEPGRKNETIVCYDSRTPNSRDLADKEINQLIDEVAAKNPHITIVMDCCHSGAGSRDPEIRCAPIDNTRRAPIDKRQRPIESYIISKAKVEELSTSRSLESNPSGWNLSAARYVFMAACRDIEEAKEYTGDGKPRGAFSYFFIKTLQDAKDNLTYRDLFKRTQAMITAKVKAQSPQLEATVQGDIYQPFLGGAITPRTPYFTVSNHPDDGWVIDGGAIHGIVNPVDEETTTLALFPFDSSPQELSELSAALGEAQVTEVKPQRSKINISGISQLDPDTTYKAVVTSLPLPPVLISISGDPAGVELAREALATASPEGKPSLYVREATPSETAEFQLLVRKSEYVIVQPIDRRPLVAPIEGYTPETAEQAIARLEHMARWTNIATLSSPANSQISSNAVRMEIFQNGQEIKSPEIRLEYQQEQGKWKEPTFQVKLTNTSNDPLYCTVLDLTDRYAVKTGLFQPTSGIWLQPGESAWAVQGGTLYAQVPKELWQQGITEVKDIYKLIVSTAEFDANLLAQDNLDAPRTRAIGGLAGKRKSTFNRLMNKVQTRDFATAPEDEEFFDDWVTSQVLVTTVRPQHNTPVPQRGETVALGAGVTLQSHSNLQAKARLTTITQSTRNLANHVLPPILRTEDKNLQPFQFTSTRGTDPGLSALELSEVQNRSVVTPETPLKLMVEQSLGKEEQLLPLAYDGEFFLPLGYANTKADNTTEIVLERLPEPVSDGKRSLGGSIQILFQKVLTEKLALEFQYPVLAAVDVSSETSINYIKDSEKVKAKVEKAEKILLYIHGIIGDTKSLVPSVQTAKIDVNGNSQSLAELYDVVLTFDYENLNTSIEENAQLLKQRLASVGLKENHGKTLHIVAHSMGGLVSRWFIEREGGNKIVQHLIMLGTPNGGSPWPKVQDWATTALAVGLNGLSTITWPVPVIGQLLSLVGTGVGAIETIDVTLDQIAPNSPFLTSLATSPDPGIPYTIIAGNTSLVPTALESESESRPPLIERLMQKLSDRVVKLPFFGQPNDIAVSIYSIKNVPVERTLPPNVLEIPCDHLVYFTHQEGLKGLSEAIAKALSLDFLQKSGNRE